MYSLAFILSGLGVLLVGGAWLTAYLLRVDRAAPPVDVDHLVQLAKEPPLPAPRRPSSPARTSQSWPPAGQARSTASGAHRPVAPSHPPVRVGRHAIDSATTKLPARTPTGEGPSR